MAIHRHKLGDAYLIFLTNDWLENKEAVSKARKSLRFLDDDTAAQ